MSWPTACETTSTDKVIVFQENRSRIEFRNPRQLAVRRVTIDGCTIRNGERCDYLMIRVEDGAEYFVELKGSDVTKACQQLKRTVGLIGSNNNVSRICFVISTRCPLISTEIQVLKAYFRKHCRALLIIKNTPLVHPIS